MVMQVSRILPSDNRISVPIHSCAKWPLLLVHFGLELAWNFAIVCEISFCLYDPTLMLFVWQHYQLSCKWLTDLWPSKALVDQKLLESEVTFCAFFKILSEMYGNVVWCRLMFISCSVSDIPMVMSAIWFNSL